LTKRVTLGDRDLRKGQGWSDYGAIPIGLEAHGTTLGLVGLGRIGGRVAEIARALGMHVLAFDPYAAPARAEALGVTLVGTLEELLASAEIVSLHCPAIPATYQLINARTLALMRRGSYLINVARGTVIDEAALADALRSGHLAGAGLDVFDPEPAAADNPLFSLPNTICTPHIASYTEASVLSLGGDDCIWVGMNGGSISGQARSFRDYRAICARTPIILLDHQTRSNAEGFQHNAFAGKLIHGMLGWDKLIPESMPMYQIGTPMFRLATKTPAEARAWMLAGFAGGIQPWWHHVSAYHEDRRMYRTAEPIMRWHRENERYLVDRTPVASVGVVWSQRSVDFYGRDAADELAEQPLRGWMQALVRARIPYRPVHVDQIAESSDGLAVLILPNLGALDDAQASAIRRFVERGGSLIATGQTSLFDEWGDARPDFALADLLGVSRAGSATAARAASERLRGNAAAQTYLRLTPELRAGVDGPHVAREPLASGARHPVLAGFEQTDILPYGGALEPLRVADGASVLATFVPAFPAFPPETAWMREPRTELPGVVVNETGGRRVAFVPADIDRRYAIDNLPDHGDLLANLVRWAARDSIPLRVDGPGLLDVELYRQTDRLVLHIVNLTGVGSWRAPMEEIVPVGPVSVRVRVGQRETERVVRWRVGGRTERVVPRDGWLRLTLPLVREHELALIE